MKERTEILSKPGILLRIEGAALFGLSLYLYRSTGAGWGWFLLLLLWPDIAMLGYLANVKLGARLYNLTHFVAFPAALAGVSLITHRSGLLSFALIWVSHNEWDRTLGYGLKYPTFFKDTHLQRVG